MFAAHVYSTRTERETAREFVSAELASQNLVILLRADGWSADPADTVRRLVAGETITHKSFTYRVSEV